VEQAARTLARVVDSPLRTARQAELAGRALAVLSANWRGRHTVPAARLYPHQWSWDSAFIAIGLSHVAQHRAQVELATLLGAQWPDGRIPHIVFDPDTPADAYFPGPRFWAPSAGGPTSGIVQPPVHARAAWEVFRRASDPDAAAGFLRRAYEPLCRWHDYLLTCRDLGGGGLAAIVHPWESGMDNSPAWDAALAELKSAQAAAPLGPARRDLHHVAAAQRPGDDDYAAYIELAACYRDRGYADHGAPAAHGFAVEDPLFNGLLADSVEALAQIAAVAAAAHAPHTARAHRIGAALTARLYDPSAGMFFPRDLRSDRLVESWSAAGLGALVSPGLPATVTARVAEHVTGRRFGPPPGLRPRSGWLLPSYDRTAAEFDPQLYWRGPSWANVTWVVRRGLQRAGRRGAADGLARGLLRTVERAGFREYFDPETGAGAGTDDFSWTAALTLDLLSDHGTRPTDRAR
jgi:hypothetical protein